MCASTPTDAPFRLRALLVVQLAVTSTTDGFAAQLELERLRLQRAHVELDVQRERGLNLERESRLVQLKHEQPRSAHDEAELAKHKLRVTEQELRVAEQDARLKVAHVRAEPAPPPPAVGAASAPAPVNWVCG